MAVQKSLPGRSIRADSKHEQMQIRVPADILRLARDRSVILTLPAVGRDSEVTVERRIRDRIRLSLQTRDPLLARARQASIHGQLERTYAAIRSGPCALTHKQVVALAGEVYRLHVERFADDPGSADAWAAWKAFNRAVIEGRVGSAPTIVPGDAPDGHMEPAREAFGENLTDGVDSLPKAAHDGLEARFGLLASWVLAKHGLDVAPDSRKALLKAIGDAAQDVGWHLKRNAMGDYRPDPKASRFPTFEASKTVSFDLLFERWQAEAKPAASTITTWKAVVESIKTHLGKDDARALTDDDVLAWKDALIERGLTAKTIGGTYLAGLKAILAAGVSRKLIPANPASKVTIRSKTRAGQGRLPYTDQEVANLLALASQEARPDRRWLPILAASSGARIGELAQLWGSRITIVDDIPIMEIRPAEDGGSLKNEGSERTIPLHPIVVQAGFLDYVRAKGNGPLFYGRSSGKPGKRHASKGVTNRIAEWVREAGFTDPRKAPSHALRHWWKTAARRAGVQDSLTDDIQGHAGRSDADVYRHLDLQTALKAIESVRLPAMPGNDRS